MALGALAGLRDRGISVPGDIAVGVFGDVPAMDFVRPRFTGSGYAPAELARRAAARLIERLSGAYTGPPRHEVVEGPLRVFDSA